ncbi:MAG: SIMPL domain-containing protein [Cyanobacteria bacterium J06638_22]
MKRMRSLSIQPRKAWLVWVPLVVGALSLAVLPPAIAQEIMRTITVTGEATESIQTTLAQVNLGVQVQAPSAEAAQAEAASRSNAVIEFLQSREVDKLETTGISLYPIYDYSNDRQQITGYRATNTVSFQLPTTEAGSLLDEAVEAGATRIDGVSFIATDEAIAAAREDALRAAAQDAQEEADVVLSALGFQGQEIVSIQIDNAVPPQPLFQQAEALDARASAPTPVIGGEQDVRARVTLQIRY